MVDRSAHEPATDGCARAADEIVGEPKLADLVDQRHGIGIAHHGPVEVGDGQCKARALQQAAQFAHVDHRRHAWRNTTQHRSFRRQP